MNQIMKKVMKMPTQCRLEMAVSPERNPVIKGKIVGIMKNGRRIQMEDQEYQLEAYFLI